MKEKIGQTEFSLHTPGEKLKPHKTPVEVFFYVLEGTLIKG